MVHLLLSFRPDLSIRDVFGLRAIHYCAFDNLKESFAALAAAENITDTLELEAFRQRLVREVCALIPRYDEMRNVYCAEEGGEFASILDFYTQRGPVAAESGSVVATNEMSEAARVVDGSSATADAAGTVHVTESANAAESANVTELANAAEPDAAKSVHATESTNATESANAIKSTATTEPTPATEPTPTPTVTNPTATTPQMSYLCRHNGHLSPVRRCTFCHIYTPPRAFHCRLCDT